ncbi:glycosyltransferase [Flavobacteriaceae bacterium 3-367]|uniref:glycosyltransferase n=1 Tax=Eudoraea algarum TaxID=3417568 RepID=UPI003276C3B2
MDQKKLTIVVPCFNEYYRLPVADFSAFLNQHPQVALCFVNDASTDKTLQRLHTLQNDFPHQVVVLNNEKNLGKAESVRKGVLEGNAKTQSPVLAYLDADLATSLEECYALNSYLVDGKEFVFASRILKIGSVVERKFSRFLFGRVIATFISNILDLKVYDTQCGCKVFKASLSQILFERPFISKWLFDVELFSRLLVAYGKPVALAKMEEIPVRQWIDQGDSKVKLAYFFRLWYDLFLIRREHRKNSAQYRL